MHEPETHTSVTRPMQGESLAAQPATLLTRLTGLATLQVRRCGHWQEVRSIDVWPEAALSHLQLRLQLMYRAVEPVLALSAAAGRASGMQRVTCCYITPV